MPELKCEKVNLSFVQVGNSPDEAEAIAGVLLTLGRGLILG